VTANAKLVPGSPAVPPAKTGLSRLVKRDSYCVLRFGLLNTGYWILVLRSFVIRYWILDIPLLSP